MRVDPRYISLMPPPRIDYREIVSRLDRPLDPKILGDSLLAAMAVRYMSLHADGALLLLEQAGATYLFDHASSIDSSHDDRTVAAWALTPSHVGKRDVHYQRG